MQVPAEQAYLAPDSVALEQRLAELEEEYAGYSLAPPIVLAAVGGGVGIISAYVGLIGELTDDCNYDFEYGTTCEQNDTTAFWVIAGIGGAVVLTGLIWMTTRITGRAPIRREIMQLRRQLRWRGQRATLDLSPAGAQLRIRF